MTGLQFLVWGAGGHGKVVADVIRSTGQFVVGYIDRDQRKVLQWNDGAGSKVVAGESEVIRLIAQGHKLPAGANAIALGVGDNAERTALLGHLATILHPPLIHPSAVVSKTATMAASTVVMPLAAINAGASVGEAAIVNTGAIIEHDCIVGRGAHISPGAVLAGGVQVGARSWVGAAAIIIPGVRIGDDCVIGAGAVVLKDVPNGRTVVGNPANLI